MLLVKASDYFTNKKILEDFMKDFNEKQAFFLNQQAERIGDLFIFDIRFTLPPIWVFGFLLCGLWVWLSWYWGLLISSVFWFQLVVNSSWFQFWVLKKGLKKKGFTGELKRVKMIDGVRVLVWDKI